MRFVIQRVREASVSVDGKNVAAIGRGLCILAGFHGNDTARDIEYLCKKALSLRIFSDDNGVMNLSARDISGEILLVPQFTLYGSGHKGNRPSYSAAMEPERAREYFTSTVEYFRNNHGTIEHGVFGADMDVQLINHGPVTILLDSSKLF